MFRYLPYVDLIRVASVATERHLAAGTVVFNEGDPADSLYVVLDGTATVLKSGVLIVEIAPGGHFGEMSLVERMPRSATVCAKTELDVLVLEREPFYGLLSEEHVAVKLLWAMLRMLNRRLRETSDELSQLDYVLDSPEPDIRRALFMEAVWLMRSTKKGSPKVHGDRLHRQQPGRTACKHGADHASEVLRQADGAARGLTTFN